MSTPHREAITSKKRSDKWGQALKENGTSHYQGSFYMLQALCNLLRILIEVVAPLLRRSRCQGQAMRCHCSNALSSNSLFLQTNDLTLLRQFKDSTTSSHFLLNELSFPIQDLLPTKASTVMLTRNALRPPNHAHRTYFHRTGLSKDQCNERATKVRCAISANSHLFQTRHINVRRGTKDIGRGHRPFPGSRVAPVYPPVFSVVLLREKDPGPMPYAGLSAFVGQSGATS